MLVSGLTANAGTELCTLAAVPQHRNAEIGAKTPKSLRFRPVILGVSLHIGNMNNLPFDNSHRIHERLHITDLPFLDAAGIVTQAVL
jgi:hypothetical protein